VSARLEWTDKRHALAAMAQVYGGTNNSKVVEAGRPEDFEALAIVEGTLTLDALRARLTARHLARDTATGTDVLRVPLIISDGATLRLQSGEALWLSNADGAFIVNFGKLEVFGGEIAAVEATREVVSVFAPFVTSVGSGTVHLSGATIRDLGFGYTAKFAGFSILSHPAMTADGRNLIQNSRIENLVSLVVSGVRRVDVHGNRFLDMRRNPLLVSGAPDAIISGNLFSGQTPTNAIRVANNSDRTELRQNVVLEGARTGLLVSSGSDNVVISRNLIWRRNGGGIKLYNVRCGSVDGNVILDDKQKGVEVRSSEDSVVSRNRIIGNANAGVWVSALPDGNVTYVLDNLIRENGSGLSTASAGDIALSGNDLSNQFPRFLDGDITQQFRAIIDDMSGRRPILLNSGGVSDARRLAPENCTLRVSGSGR
jgi:poly(beta-D-mannuronate) C5 epimerase